MQNLQSSEHERYQRHLLLSEIGEAGQLQLKAAKVLCVGAGGLGSVALYYLAAAGVGTLGIIDDDVVDLSNLQRQILYSAENVGRKKITCAKERLKSFNPHITVNTYDLRLTTENALTIISSYDIVIDATDNYASRYLINDASFHCQKPMVYAGIHQFSGQAAVFHYQGSACYRCLYPEPPPPNLRQNCADAGVLGVLPGILGSIQATETIKLILSLGQSLTNRLLTIDTLTMQFNQYAIKQDDECCLCVKHQNFFNMPYHDTRICSIQDFITIHELQHLYKNNHDFYLLDVRHVEEYQQSHLKNSQLIPLQHLAQSLHKLPKDKHIIIYCHHDTRSQYALQQLKQSGFTQVQYLKGGIAAWELSEAENIH